MLTINRLRNTLIFLVVQYVLKRMSYIWMYEFSKTRFCVNKNSCEKPFEKLKEELSGVLLGNN